MNSNLPNTEPQEAFFLTDEAQLRRWMPWLTLFRAFRVALGHRQLMVGFVAVWLLAGGMRLISSFEGNTQTPLASGEFHLSDKLPKVGETPINYGVAELVMLTGSATREVLVGVKPLGTWSLSLLKWVWMFGILLLFGGMSSRLAALELTQSQHCSLTDASSFVGRRIGAYSGGIALAAGGFLLFAFFNAVIGSLGNIPVVGPILLWVGYPVALCFGLLLTLLAVGLAASWPLMICTISVDGTDAFDALSRSFNYIYSRTWYALFLVVVMLLFGWGLQTVVTYFVSLIQTFTDYSVGYWLNREVVDPVDIVLFWRVALSSVPVAFSFSYFWVGGTIVYLLLRKSEDATPLTSVYLEDQASDELPLVGIPAANLREKQTAGESE
ncbi:MAG: hypothetical protein R3C18_24425 [Planctomycetaceae bacterium]